MGSLGLLLIGVSFELGAVLALLADISPWKRLAAFILLHLVSSISLASLVAVLFPRWFADRHAFIRRLFFSFTFFLPVFGMLGTFITLFYFRVMGNEGSAGNYESLSTRLHFSYDAAAGQVSMGEGGAWSRLKSTSAPRQQRLKAILAVSNTAGLNSSRLLQMATGDTDDEIRLLAFNLFDKREKTISASANEALALFKQETDDDARGQLCKKLAFAYWEYVYNDLAKDDLKTFYVNQALHYGRMAFSLNVEDPALLILLGRIYMFQGDLDSAEITMTKAIERGAHRDRVIPYFAELAFRKRDFAVLRSTFALDASLRYKPGIGGVASFWLEEGV